MDEILNALEISYLGRFANSSYLGALAYTDDLLLLSSFLSMLQQMLDLCCEVGKLYDLLFHPSKTVCGVFGLHSTEPIKCISLAGALVHWSNKLLYLGITFMFGTHLTGDITNRLNKFYAAISSVLKDKLFGFKRVYVHFLLSKYLPILFYGLDSMVINRSIVQAVTKAWNMAFRWIFGLRKFDSTRLPLESCGNMSAKFLRHKRLLLFYNSVAVLVYVCTLLNLKLFA